MKINSKTQLRREILSRVGNTGWLDNIWFDSYGNWSIHSAGTICPNELKITFGFFSQEYGETVKELNRSITIGFLEIESMVDEL